MGADFRRWWSKPAVYPPDTTARQVTWLELFYDLVFAVIIARLAHHLSGHPNPAGVRDFLLLFASVWWVWVSGTYYNERFETFDLSFRVFVFLQMLSVAAMAATAEEGTGRTASGFALSYAAARTILTLMWFRAGRHNPQVRPVTSLYIVAFSFSIVLWVISAILPVSPLTTLLRVIGILTELAVPLLTLSAQRRVFRGRARKLPERFGLFVLIVLGENLVGVVNGLTEAEHVDLSTLLRFLLGFTLGFGLWWVYFDNVARREPRSEGGSLTLSFWIYLHLPLMLGVAAIGSMLAHSIEVSSGAPEGGVRWILSAAFALCYLCMAGLEFTLEPEVPPLIQRRVSVLYRIGTAGLALTAPLVPLPLSGLVGVLVGLNLIHMVLGVRAWFSSSNAGRTDVH